MEKDIGKIKKNDETDVIIRVDDFGGNTGLTIREFVKSENYTGFTKAGVRIRADKFEDFKKIINSIDPADLSEPKKQEEAKATDDNTGVDDEGLI
jgi:hypothetical protein